MNESLLILNIGYALTFIALAIREVLWLRTTLTAAQISLFTYHYFYANNNSAAFWTAIFVFVNTYNIIKILLERRPKIIPDEIRDREAVATVVAYVLKIGPLAYKDPDKFGPGPEPWCKEGQWVCIGRYSGSRFKIDGGEVRIINDDEVIATILEPDDIKHV